MNRPVLRSLATGVRWRRKATRDSFAKQALKINKNSDAYCALETISTFARTQEHQDLPLAAVEGLMGLDVRGVVQDRLRSQSIPRPTDRWRKARANQHADRYREQNASVSHQTERYENVVEISPTQHAHLHPTSNQNSENRSDESKPCYYFYEWGDIIHSDGNPGHDGRNRKEDRTMRLSTWREILLFFFSFLSFEPRPHIYIAIVGEWTNPRA